MRSIGTTDLSVHPLALGTNVFGWTTDKETSWAVLDAYVEHLESPRPEHLPYAVSLVKGVDTHRDRIDETISTYAEGWTIDRMPVVDRNLARIAVYELFYVDEIDDPVAITEAVELAKELSTDDSPRFLNGLLGRIADYAPRT